MVFKAFMHGKAKRIGYQARPWATTVVFACATHIRYSLCKRFRCLFKSASSALEEMLTEIRMVGGEVRDEYEGLRVEKTGTIL